MNDGRVKVTGKPSKYFSLTHSLPTLSKYSLHHFLLHHLLEVNIKEAIYIVMQMQELKISWSPKNTKSWYHVLL